MVDENRYSRQLLFPPIQSSGQEKISQSTVAVIGCGALGSAIAETLTRAGVGKLILVDRDYVESSNLQRQQLYTEDDANQMLPKVVAAEKRLKQIRSDIRIDSHLKNLDAPLMASIAKESTLLMDATDNFETRMLVNDCSIKHNVPWIYGACVGSSGVVFPFIPGVTACFRCLFPMLPTLNQTCDTAGIIAPAVSVTAAIQCAEALKWLTGNVEEIRKKVHYFDIWNAMNMDIGVSKMKKIDCPSCGEHRDYPALQQSNESTITVLCGRNVVQILPSKSRVVPFEEAEQVAKKLEVKMKKTPYFLEMNVFDRRILLFADGRLLIHGTSKKEEGRKIYHQLFG